MGVLIVPIARLHKARGHCPPARPWAMSQSKPDQLLGEWNGGYFDTGHPVATQLEEIKWVGKSFKTLEDVDPVIVERDGKRVS